MSPAAAGDLPAAGCYSRAVATREIRVGRLADLADRQTAKFRFREDGQSREGFVIRIGDDVRAYRNECRHIPMTMDWVENRFLSPDGCYIQCATHGALYDPESGHCVAGPPAGESLRAFAVAVRDGEIFVRVA